MGKKDFVNQQYSVAQKGGNLKDGTKKTRSTSFISGTFFSISLIISVTLVAFSIVFFFSPVYGSSMMATLNANCPVTNISNFTEDSVLVNRFKQPVRGDIIVVKFYYTEGSARAEMHDSGGGYSYFIKRLIAFGGESVYFRREPNDLGGFSDYKYIIEVNGEPINESYLDLKWGKNITYEDFWNMQQGTATYPAYYNSQDVPTNWYDSAGQPCFQEVTRNGITRRELVIPQDRMFFMGDNRGGDNDSEGKALKSMDCTCFGPQPAANLVGTVVEKAMTGESPLHYAWRKICEFFTFRWLF